MEPDSGRGAGHRLYPGTVHLAHIEPLGSRAADRFAEVILADGADSVATVFVTPVQNAEGFFPQSSPAARPGSGNPRIDPAG